MMRWLLGTFLARSLAAMLAAEEAPDPLANAASLEKEGARWFAVAGDTDLAFAKRNEARKLASGLLREAYRILDEHVTAHPAAMDAQSPAEKILVLRLTRDLRSRDAEVRRRAALDLGLLGTSEGSYQLVQRLRRETETPVAEAIRTALVQIGGVKTIDLLADLVRSRKPDELSLAVRLLLEIGGRDPVQGRISGLALARFLGVSDETTRTAAFDALLALGSAGGVAGIGEALGDSRAPVGRRLRLIKALGGLGDPSGATALGRLLAAKGSRLLRDAAIDACRRLGIEAVPYLIPYLDGATREWTAVVLQKITRKNLGDRAAAWETWWRTRPAKPERKKNARGR